MHRGNRDHRPGIETYWRWSAHRSPPSKFARKAAPASSRSAAHLFQGYWNRPDQTSAAFTQDGWLDTGDIGQIDADGYLTLVGRAKDFIITGGYNVYPLEVEQVLEGIAGVQEPAVIGLPHPDYGEAVTAILVPTPDATLDETAVIAAVKASLASYNVNQHPTGALTQFC